MSALQRARRSRSKTAPEADDDTAQTNGTIPTSNSDLPDPSSASSPSPPAAIEGLPKPNLNSPTMSAAAMLSTLPASNPLPLEPHVADSIDIANDGLDDPADNRSSSLSEPADASDEHSEPTPRPSAAEDAVDNDSEAETERLEKTPRKLTRTATDTSIMSENTYERTPSKLIQSTMVDEDESVLVSPTISSTRPQDAPSGSAALDTLSFLAASEAASLEIAGKKRKRSSEDGSSLGEPTDEPARKRSGTIKDVAVNGDGGEMVDKSEQVDMEEELDNAEERVEVLAQEEAELEERQSDVAAETISELATVAKLTKPRKGGRRGKRKPDDSGGAGEAATSTEGQEAEGDGDNEEEDSAALDEEVTKKKNAIEELAKIERKFKIFREKLCDEQIAQYEQELEMLRQPNCTHPEYLAMVQCIDERRASKIAYEKQLLEYKQQCLERTTTAERHQLHSQYFQTVRDIRENVLSECNQRIYELQRGRRQLGVEEIEYSIGLPRKRSERIRQQAAYNLEVSVLSGVAKYVGFPAAPDIKPARPSEIEDDLRAMKINTLPIAQPIPYVRAYNRNSTADEVAAEEQFIERTPWANPQHPAHQQAHFAVVQGPPRAQTYQTPAGQRRIVDIHAPNGSASTIEVNSNPPSSTVGRGLHSNGRVESESPVLQMKRNPSDHPQYSETPGSHPRNLAGIGRDSYANNPHMLSSPAVEPPAEDQGARWAGGIRPLNAGVSPVPANVGRPVPLAQRASLGAVSVGSGGQLFGR